MLLQIIKSSVLVIAIFSCIIAAVPLSVSHNEKQEDNIFHGNNLTGIQIIRYEWAIENLNFSWYKQGQLLISTTFWAETNDEYQWSLGLSPKGDRQSNQEYMSLYICSDSGNISANIRLGFLNAKNEEINTLEFLQYFDEPYCTGYSNFALRDFVINEQNRLFINDSLTIFCEIKTNVSISQDLSGKSKQTPLKEDLDTDLAVLLDNELFSDILILSDGKNFSAHKAILAVRCPPLKDMFQYDSQVANISWVNMTDVDSKVMNEMLRYIYTGKILNLEDLALTLLPEAKKYKCVSLKTKCEHYISSQISIKNAVKYFKFGDRYSAVYLKNQAKDFIIAHLSEVGNTSEFESLPETDFLLYDEIFTAVVKALQTH